MHSAQYTDETALPIHHFGGVLVIPRRLAFALASALVISLVLVTSPVRTAADEVEYGDIIGPVTPTSMGIRLPMTIEEVRSLTPAHRERIERALYARLPEWARFVDNGEVRPKAVSGLPQAWAGIRGFARPLATSAWGQCRVEWSDVFGGSWMRGYALTRADTVMDSISVGLELLRDGSTVAGPNGATGSGSNVEQPTSWVWKNWDEHFNWTTSSLHTARDNGIYYLGPDSPCNVSKTY